MYCRLAAAVTAVLLLRTGHESERLMGLLAQAVGPKSPVARPGWLPWPFTLVTVHGRLKETPLVWQPTATPAPRGRRALAAVSSPRAPTFPQNWGQPVAMSHQGLSSLSDDQHELSGAKSPSPF